jgi:hypothetical protein
VPAIVALALLAGQSAAIGAAGRPPRNAVPPVVTGSAIAGHLLTATKGSWLGRAPLTVRYRWQRCDARALDCVAIAGALSAGYVLAAADVGSTVRVSVTASNGGQASAPAYSSPTGVVARPVLIAVRPPTIAGVAQVGETLTATSGRWQTRERVTIGYRWLRCRRDGSDCVRVRGATRGSYRVRAADMAARLRVWVTAIAAGGTSTQESALSRIVMPRRPASMRPFPVVHIKGYATAFGAVLQLVSVTAPRGARVDLSCRGGGCPFSRRRQTVSGGVRIRSLERSFAVGARIVIRIVKPSLIGKYTSVVIRQRAAPRRHDRCLMPNRTEPVPCPARERVR